MIGKLIACALCFTGAHIMSKPTDSVAHQPDFDRLARENGVEIARQVSYDLCFPATQAEYVALGKNAILRLEASSMDAGELPLRAVYVVHGGIRIPLKPIATVDAHDDPVKHRMVQVSFYLMPLRLRKLNAQLEADFAGRTGFMVDRFAPGDRMGPGAPAFVRRDPHDAPGKYDAATVVAVLKREYPADMQ